jgi:hypothetical protein
MKVRRSLIVFIASINSGENLAYIIKTPSIVAPVREIEDAKDR